MSTHIQSSHAFHGISLHVSITVAPENIDKFLAAFKVCFDRVTAEPECTFFEIFRMWFSFFLSFFLFFGFFSRRGVSV